MMGSWRQQIIDRGNTRFFSKFIGITAYISVFMLAYFVLLRHPQFAVREVPLQWLDAYVHYTPWAFWPYVSLWVYIGLVPISLYLNAEMRSYVLQTSILAVAGLALFFFWPTVTPPMQEDWSRYAWVAWLKSTDASGNACPSLHVAFAVFTCIWLQRLLRHMRAPRYLQGVNIVWCVLIIWSALALKQHVALDAELGLVLGAGVAWSWRPRLQNHHSGHR